MGKLLNHLIYADDFCLLTTSKSSLDRLLNICDKYAENHGLTFNSSKTQLQTFFPRWLNNLNPNTTVTFKNTKVPSVKCVRYLGFLVEQDTKWNVDVLSHEEEIGKKSAEIYKRAYMLRSKFNKCSLKVKKYLFTTYLSTSVQEKKITVAYNNAFRIVCNFRRDCSATEMFKDNKVKNLRDIRKVAIYSLLGRNQNSSNEIIDFVAYSDIHGKSKISSSWKTFCEP